MLKTKDFRESEKYSPLLRLGKRYSIEHHGWRSTVKAILQAISFSATTDWGSAAAQQRQINIYLSSYTCFVPFHLLYALHHHCSFDSQRFVMSLEPRIDTLINPQPRSKFFAAPVEIRRAICVHIVPRQIHISLRTKGFWLLACVQHDEDDDPNCIQQRISEDNPFDTDPNVHYLSYALRPRSSWGTHWRCEELSTQMQEKEVNKDGTKSLMALLPCMQANVRQFSCWSPSLLTLLRRSTQVVEMMADYTTFQIHDLGSLGMFAAHSQGPKCLLELHPT